MNILKILTEKRRIGNFGERAAARLLRRRGYRILERNYVFGDAEIDIIASDSEHTVFVEVKTRKYGTESPTEPRPASAVTPEKQRAIIKAARGYAAYYPSSRRMRFDVVEVLYDGDGRRRKVRDIQHLEGAFNMDTATKGYRK